MSRRASRMAALCFTGVHSTSETRERYNLQANTRIIGIHAWQRISMNLPLFEIACLLARLYHVAVRIVNADHSVM
jgi:hypothetical protein